MINFLIPIFILLIFIQNTVFADTLNQYLNHNSYTNSSANDDVKKLVTDSQSTERITLSKNLENFNEIESKISANIEITLSDENSCEIIGNKNTLKKITTNIHRVNNNTRLVIDSSSPYLAYQFLKIKILVKNFSALIQSGAGNITINNYHGEMLKVVLYGVGNIFGYGQVRTLQAFIEGSGIISFEKLIANQVYASILGSGEIMVHSRNKMTAEIHGNGEIIYAGKPNHVDQTVTGNGQIIRLH
ncbi:MAG: DUF2807 domain-containing protein [Gammaproteobacteria bacterium]|nr:DUF2807 domain-containing protein [Gammaproteobacteria bacterium]